MTGNAERRGTAPEMLKKGKTGSLIEDDYIVKKQPAKKVVNNLKTVHIHL